MDEWQAQLEQLAFAEKIALSKLEESKAAERTKEIEYEFARFNLECGRMMAKLQQAAATARKPENIEN